MHTRLVGSSVASKVPVRLSPIGQRGVAREVRSSAPTILVVGTDDWAIEQSATELEAGGCRVLRCHEPGEPAFPCNALVEGRTCPLDVGFDVVVAVRARPLNTPSPAELGVVCALHAGAPLVVAGVGSDRLFGPWAAATVEPGGAVLTACESVASAAEERASSGEPVRHAQ